MAGEADATCVQGLLLTLYAQHGGVVKFYSVKGCSGGSKGYSLKCLQFVGMLKGL